MRIRGRARRGRRHVGSKWAKTKAILRDRSLRGYVPETRRLNEKSLRRMLQRYAAVYVKPVAGTHGKGVMRIARSGGAYSCRWRRSKSRHRSLASLYGSLRRRCKGRPYLVQRGIPLLTYRGRLFDIRVMVQKNPQKRWETTGMIGRVAHPAQIVTNYHSGGKPTDVRILLRRYVSAGRMKAMTGKLARIGRLAAAALNRAYPGVNMVGADIGLDAALKPWIIELNTSPDPYLFRFLNDKSVSAKVLRYARALRRIP